MALVRRFRPLLLALALLLSPIGPVACAAQGPSADLGCGTTGVPCLKGQAVVRRGAYNGTVFHRVVRDPIPFVVQGGDPQGADPKVPVDQLGTGSFIDPASGQPRLIPLELFLQGEAKPRYGDIAVGPGQQTKLKLQHQRGALAMARSADPNSASAQFYIALKALPELDGRYAVFGRVTQGMEVVDKISQGDRLVKATLVEGGTLVKD